MPKKITKEPYKYLKSELLKSNQLMEYVDVLTVILEDDKSYSIKETKSLIEKFLKAEVN